MTGLVHLSRTAITSNSQKCFITSSSRWLQEISSAVATAKSGSEWLVQDVPRVTAVVVCPSTRRACLGGITKHQWRAELFILMSLSIRHAASIDSDGDQSMHTTWLFGMNAHCSHLCDELFARRSGRQPLGSITRQGTLIGHVRCDKLRRQRAGFQATPSMRVAQPLLPVQIRATMIFLSSLNCMTSELESFKLTSWAPDRLRT